MLSRFFFQRPTQKRAAYAMPVGLMSTALTIWIYYLNDVEIDKEVIIISSLIGLGATLFTLFLPNACADFIPEQINYRAMKKAAKDERGNYARIPSVESRYRLFEDNNTIEFEDGDATHLSHAVIKI